MNPEHQIAAADVPKRGRTAWPLWARGLRAVALAYLLVLMGMMFLERRLLFFPAPYPEGDWHPTQLTFEDAWFQAADGTKLHGWYVPHGQPRAVLLIASGNAGNVTVWAEQLERLHHNFQVAAMVFDYRGYGRSEGTPHEAGILSDARAARTWLAQRVGVAESQVVLWGRSLGGGVMVDLAARDGARGLILERTFSALPDVAAYHYPWLPVRWLMRTRLDSLSKIGRYHGPLLQTHGDADEVVPLALGQRLFAAANEPKRFLLERQANHNDPASLEFEPALKEFLDALP